MAFLVRALGISKVYGATTVLSDTTLELEGGAVHGLLGPNGSGKSTCLHLLTGLASATTGLIEICGIPIKSKESRRKFGFAPDDLPLPETLSGREYLTWIDRLRGREDLPRALALAEALDMEKDLRRAIGEYSHGMKRKLQVIAATMHSPQVLILDEPFRGLDPAAAVGLLTAINAFRADGRVVLIATHDLLRAERDCDTVTILDFGHVIASGSPEELRTEIGANTLEEVFLGRTGISRDYLSGMAGSITRTLVGER